VQKEEAQKATKKQKYFSKKIALNIT